MKHSIWLLRLITFLASFLLFQIQFIVGKIFLANFGGGFMVWGACLVFFQAALLLGYLYAHKMSDRFGMAKYLWPHGCLLVAAGLVFPLRPLGMTYSGLGFPMVADVFIHLTLSIGMVFFALSTMSIICQAWLAASCLEQKENPYALFAVSNFGSLLALITYPFIFEMFFDLHQQQNLWRALYGLMVLLYFAGVRLVRVRARERQDEGEEMLVKRGRVWQWFFYGAGGVAMFLAVTNVLTAEIAPMPLLWMLPLMIYLFSYVLNFKARPWCPAWIEKTIHPVTGFGIVLYFVTVRHVVPVVIGMMLMLGFVFMICMFCQRRLYALRPDPCKLTFFYFVVSLGGFVGGAVTTWIVPLLYVNYAEYILGLVFVFTAWFLEEDTARVQRRVSFFILVVALLAAVYWGPFFLRNNGSAGLAGFAVFVILGFHMFRTNRAAALSVLTAMLVLLDVIQPKWLRQAYVYGHRNYYGITKVVERAGLRMLFQGTTMHGAQFTDPEKSFIPLTYYNPKSPPARLLIHEEQYTNIAIVGLGTGALAMYGRPGQVFDFYELDPDILPVAETYFDFLRLSAAKIHYIIDDARVGLERMAEKSYEILIVDAFSGDSVPVHLLTRECLDLYRRRITQDGVVLFHLANRYINLPQAFIQTASSTEAYVAYKKDQDSASDWVALTYDVGIYMKLIKEYGWTSINKEKHQGSRPWTDAYSNIIPFFLRAEVLSSLSKQWDMN